MQKAYYFLWRRAGMARAEFIDYYETTHAALILANLLRPTDFRGNYPVWDLSNRDYFGRVPFDVLTAITYPSHADFETSLKIYFAQPFNDLVTEDELRFIDRGRVKFATIDEVINGAPESTWFPAPLGAGEIKLLRVVRRPDRIDPAQFRAHYEATEAPAMSRLITGCNDYRRNYIRMGDDISYETPNLQAESDDYGLVQCDLIEEFCFENTMQAKAAAERLDSQPVLAGPLKDMTRTPAILSDQRIRWSDPGASGPR